ncbi:hypothetical protein PQQ88_01255 [Paraburkholderia caledonica]|uniref:hypothetical protein n=1 Tax=Paraburkholderia caledonica TaxID=134536 RepID=UPI0038BB60E0
MLGLLRLLSGLPVLLQLLLKRFTLPLFLVFLPRELVDAALNPVVLRFFLLRLLLDMLCGLLGARFRAHCCGLLRLFRGGRRRDVLDFG